MITTNVYKGFKLHIPKEIRQRHNITEDDQVTWKTEGDNNNKCKKTKKFKRFSRISNCRRRI